MHKFARLTALAAVGAGCLMVAACSSGSSGSSPAVGGASASVSSTPDPLAALSTTAIATKAMANLKAASSVTMKGNLVVSGQAVTFDLGIKSGAGCAGSIGLGSKGNIKVVVMGKTVYFNADDGYWKAYAGSSADAAIKWANGRYVKTTTSSSMGSLTQLCDLTSMMDSMKLTEKMTKGKVTTLDGVKVLPLSQGADGTAYVTDTANPEFAKIESPKNSTNGTIGALTFSFAPVTVTAPAASDVVDESTAPSF
jgi:hypothetical protein